MMGGFRLAVAVSLLCGLSACTDDQGTRSLVLLQNVRAQSNDGACVGIDGSDPSSALAHGVLDLVSADALYLMIPVIQNLVVSEDMSPTGLAQRTAFIEGYEINADLGDLVDSATAEQLDNDGVTSFTGATTFFIPPNDISSISVAGTSQAMVDELRNRVPAGEEALIFLNIEFFGTLGGSSVRSTQLRFPVQVCTNCLVQVIGSCSALPDGFEASPGHACGLVQDVPVQCCEDSAGGTVCPAEVEVVE